MSTPAIDPTLERLLRHMAWANARVLAILAEQESTLLEKSEPGSDWSVSAIAHHLVDAAGFYVFRLGGGPLAEPAVPNQAADFHLLAEYCAIQDSRLLELSRLPEEILEYQRPDRLVTRARSTILAQAIHHATEHRAQIAGALAANGSSAIDLDLLDLWSYGDAQGRGE